MVRDGVSVDALKNNYSTLRRKTDKLEEAVNRELNESKLTVFKQRRFEVVEYAN